VQLYEELLQGGDVGAERGGQGHMTAGRTIRTLQIPVSHHHYALFDTDAEPAWEGIDETLTGNGLVSVNAEGTYASVRTGTQPARVDATDASPAQPQEGASEPLITMDGHTPDRLSDQHTHTIRTSGTRMATTPSAIPARARRRSAPSSPRISLKAAAPETTAQIAASGMR